MYQKPNKKSFTDGAIKALGLGVGLKVGDALSAVMPESISSYKSWIIMGLGLIAAASINPKTTAGLAAQSAALGVSANGLYNGLTEVIAPSVPVKNGSSMSDKFVNALVGHKDHSEGVRALGNAWQWEQNYEQEENNWNRPDMQNRGINIALV